jgi:hypothetical protein
MGHQIHNSNMTLKILKTTMHRGIIIWFQTVFQTSTDSLFGNVVTGKKKLTRGEHEATSCSF